MDLALESKKPKTLNEQASKDDILDRLQFVENHRIMCINMGLTKLGVPGAECRVGPWFISPIQLTTNLRGYEVSASCFWNLTAKQIRGGICRPKHLFGFVACLRLLSLDTFSS